MPNWVRCKLTCKGVKNIAKRYGQLKSKDFPKGTAIDFEKIIPLDGRDPVRIWGTKWNACGCELIDDEMGQRIEMETAWSAPIPVIRRMAVLSQKKITMEYADEDIGRNCGLLVAYPDEAVYYKSMDGDYEWAVRVWGYGNYREYLSKYCDSEREIETNMADVERWAEEMKAMRGF